MSKWKWNGGGVIRVGVGQVVEVSPGEIVEFDNKISRDLQKGGDKEWELLVSVIEKPAEIIGVFPQESEFPKRKYGKMEKIDTVAEDIEKEKL